MVLPPITCMADMFFYLYKAVETSNVLAQCNIIISVTVIPAATQYNPIR